MIQEMGKSCGLTMKLKHDKYEVISVHYKDLEALVEEVWGHEWSFVSDLETFNDTQHEFEVKKNPLDEWDLRKLGIFVDSGQGSSFYLSAALLQELANRNYIDEGTYLINICW